MFLQPAKPHVRQVLTPFEVRNRDAAGIQKNIGNNENTARMKSVFSAGRRWAVSGFGKDFAVDAIAVFQRDLIFERCGNQDVARDVPDRVRSWKRFCAGKVFDRSGFLAEVIQFFNGDAVRRCTEPHPIRQCR